jgi:hypothetical protein
MKRKINYYDIKIYGNPEIKEDFINAGYNLGDLLNMPFLYGVWEQNPHGSEDRLYRMNIIGQNYPDSILSNYITERPENEVVPNIERIINATEKYIDKTQENTNMNLNEIFKTVRDANYLCVHVRCGDLLVEEEYIEKIAELSRKYEKVVLLSGINMDEHYLNDHNKKCNFLFFMNKILERNENIFLHMDSPDNHLAIMRNASNLLLHKGGFSMLGYIVATGKVFITEFLDPIVKHTNFQRNIPIKHEMN